MVSCEGRAAAPTTAVVVETTVNKLRELRRGREEETVRGEGESGPKRRKITPTPPPPAAPVSAPSSTPLSTAAPPSLVSDVVPTPEVAEVVQAAANVAEESVVVVPTDKDRAFAAVSAPNHHPHQSVPESESSSTLPEPDPKPKPAREQEQDPLAAAATGDEDVVSAPRKIGIQHIQLVYETVGETLQCRMCLYGALRFVYIDELTNIPSCSDSGSVSWMKIHQ